MIVRRWNPDNPSNMEVTLDGAEQELVKKEFDNTGYQGKINTLKIVKKE